MGLAGRVISAETWAKPTPKAQIGLTGDLGDIRQARQAAETARDPPPRSTLRAAADRLQAVEARLAAERRRQLILAQSGQIPTWLTWFRRKNVVISRLSRPRRVVAEIEWHKGELFSPVGFILTDLRRPAHRSNARSRLPNWALSAGAIPS